MLSELTSIALTHSVFLFFNPFISNPKDRSVSLNQLHSFLEYSGIKNVPLIPFDWRLIVALSFVFITGVALVSQRRSKWLQRVAAFAVAVNFVLLTLRRTLLLWRSVALWLRLLRAALMVRSGLGWLFGQRFVSAVDSVVLLKIFGASSSLTEPVLQIFRSLLPLRVKHVDLPLSGLVMTLDLLSSMAEREII
jgi:hypothetical protein